MCRDWSKEIGPLLHSFFLWPAEPSNIDEQKGRKSEKEMKVGGSRASDQFSGCVHVRGDTCECKTRASERTNERNERTAGRDTTLGGTTFRRLSREIDCNFYLLLFYWRRKRVPFSMFFFFFVSRSRQISSVYVRARARSTPATSSSLLVLVAS